MHLTNVAVRQRDELPTAPIVVTEFDRRRLQGLIDLMRARSGNETPVLDALEDELGRAEIVDPREIPPNVVTMNSTAEVIDLDTHERSQLTIVFPGSADVQTGRISVLAPVGLALLGARVGDEVVWSTPARKRSLRIERISFQPEAAGQFDL